MANDAREGRPEQPQLTDPYSTGLLSKDYPSELARLRAVEGWADPQSIALLQSLPIRPDFRCLEMGAGAGSIAYWLADRCSHGRVVAADIDPRYLDARRFPNLEIAQTDLITDDFPKGHFDLIHARLTLSHIPQRDDILSRAIGWLKPGGWIVVEDYYVPPVSEMSCEPMRVVMGAAMDAFAAQGTDMLWARKIPERLIRLGVQDLRLLTQPLTIGVGLPSEAVWRLSLEQFFPSFLEKELLTEAEIAAYRALTPLDAIDLLWFGISVAGQRR
ncbi:methyltransferase domain-containing protein [Pendulispora brunnea]|uniref:Methyltransferase domain-containing protein n=1 Tax=Pendulispora brunnea TaxID=2905690 RepID=A0ABZ2KI18_9BACT